ncbi:MAG: aromatic ring-hydroxylating dioxygenase subunit alpha [Dehalococcoidia bacterium]
MTTENQQLSYLEQQRLAYSDLIVDKPEDFRVHSRVYKDQEVFEAEMHGIFEKTWVYVCHESEIERPGDYRTGKIGTTSVIIARDQQMDVHIMVNTCRHRANAVCRYDYGNAHNFRCPYHGWVYKNSGENIGVADRRRYPADYTPEFTQENLSLLKVRTATYRGLIFGCLDDDVPYDLDEFLGPLKKYIDRWADRSPEGEFVVTRPHLYSYNGNWKFQAENGNDGYHGGFTHQSIAMTYEHFGKTDPNQSFQKVPHGGVAGGWKFGHGRFGGRAGGVGTGGGGGRGIGGLSKEQRAEYYNAVVAARGEQAAKETFDPSPEVNGGHFLIFPNVFLFPGLIRVIYPISPEETEIASYSIKPRGVSDEIVSKMLLAEQGALSTTGSFNNDDVEMFAANQTGLRATNMEWLVLTRGLGRETSPFPDEYWGEVSDETPFRWFYREWLRLMGDYKAEV